VHSAIVAGDVLSFAASLCCLCKFMARPFIDCNMTRRNEKTPVRGLPACLPLQRKSNHRKCSSDAQISGRRMDNRPGQADLPPWLGCRLIGRLHTLSSEFRLDLDFRPRVACYTLVSILTHLITLLK